jgi:hypothetical protein
MRKGDPVCGRRGSEGGKGRKGIVGEVRKEQRMLRERIGGCGGGAWGRGGERGGERERE